MAVWLAYCRKSRIDPHDRKAVESTDRQRDRIAAWAEARGEDVEWYIEPDGSRSGGSTKNRPQYQRLLTRIQSAKGGAIRGVVVTRIDRTSRNPSDFFSFLGELDKRKLEYVALDQSFDTTTPHGRLILGVLILLAAWEREMTSDRMRESILDRQQRGYYVGRDVYGYDRSKQVNEDGHTQTSLVVNPVEAERVRAIIHRYLHGDEGDSRLARWCNGLHWPTKTGAQWTDGAMSRFLLNAMFYAGYVLSYDGRRSKRATLIPGKHEPIISVEDARAVLRKRKSRAPDLGGRASKQHVWPLTGRVWCAECGARLMVKSNGEPKPCFTAAAKTGRHARNPRLMHWSSRLRSGRR